ncbi:MAG TPA: hypothetical protein PL001_04340 [Candidatus Kryptobacter bacterium]|nr:hypothetical protein [Candidatus Kryptobacter bacterium]
MVIWHNTDDAPRTPAEVFPNDKVVIWIGSYPIELGQQIDVDLTISGSNSDEKKSIVHAEWRYNDYGRNNSYWAAILGPFTVGQKVEYRIIGTGPDGTRHVQVDGFTVIDRSKPGKKKA